MWYEGFDPGYPSRSQRFKSCALCGCGCAAVLVVAGFFAVWLMQKWGWL